MANGKRTLFIITRAVIVGNFLACRVIFKYKEANIFIARSPLDLCHWSMVGKVNERKQGRDSILWKIIRLDSPR
jgi:hypothetical protein